MTRAYWIAIGVALAAILALALVRPHEMVSPGDLIPAHAALKQDCFACHVPLRGASPAQCISCHAVGDIGRKTTAGLAIAPRPGHPAFHQALRQDNCLSCHSGHPGPKLTPSRAVSFDHDLLLPAALAQCQSCHSAPTDSLHRGQVTACATCHQPTDWKAATFAHDRYFLLEGDHKAPCTTCHTTGGFQTYSCYGCHAHEPARIIAQHREEGITNLDNCVRCHTIAHGEGREGEGEGRDRD